MIKLDLDAKLLPRIARGNQSAIREMVMMNLSRLIANGMRMLNNCGEAKDVGLETFLRLWKQAQNWQAGDANLILGSIGWLLTCVTTDCVLVKTQLKVAALGIASLPLKKYQANLGFVIKDSNYN
jgi:hypothetical protein